MHALRKRIQPALRAARLRPQRLYTSSAAASNPSPEHTPDTYQKDEAVSPPASSKTHVVSEDQNAGPRTQRPFEAPTGSYTTLDDSKPYDPPAKDGDEEQSKLRYGGKGGSGGGAQDVHGEDGPQGHAGKEGRR